MSCLTKRTIITIKDELLEEFRSTYDHLQELEDEMEPLVKEDSADPLIDVYNTLISARANMDDFLSEYNRYMRGDY